MVFTTDYKLERFILETKWDNLPGEVQNRLRGCFIDLMGALATGSRSKQFEVGIRTAKKVFPPGNIAVIGTTERFGFMGAATAMGHSSNAYDIDDGHNIIRAHPGTSFIGAILAAAYEHNITLKELLSTMYVAYETTIRMGVAIMDYYKFPHSSGTFGAVGVAAGAGRIYGFTKEQMNNVLSIAEFNAPLVPGIRSVEYPSMNKDGVPFGVMIGALAVTEAIHGFTGCKNLLESDEHKHYLDDLGIKHHVMDLYFKPYTCCRWAHPAIDACIGLMRENGISAGDIERVTIKTFQRATMLSKIVPKNTDEAQYNIAYPVAASLVYGDFGLGQAADDRLGDPAVVDMMKRLSFEKDDEIDAKFPQRRICRAVLTLKDGRTFTSADCEPRGEANENIDINWLADKFRRITAPVLTPEGQQNFLDAATGDIEKPVCDIVDDFNHINYWVRN